MSTHTVFVDADLRSCNTLQVAAKARYLVQVHDALALDAIIDDTRFEGLPMLTLGDASNVLLTGDIDGVVLKLDASAVGILSETDESAIVRAQAGLAWDTLVSWSLEHGLSGIENLALIPGRCGAAPIQNIGAYGVEFSDVAVAVEAFDRHTRQHIVLNVAECAFGYRDSVFKRRPERYVVTAIHLKLQRQATLRIDYAGIREELGTMAVADPTAADVAAAVRQLRRRKLPQPDVLPNAGSFFKNPVVDAQTFRTLQSRHPELPHWPMRDSQNFKLSAAWLIEKSGMKGHRRGDAGIAAQHALVLVNHGHASGTELLDLAREVQARVQHQFHIGLEIEPVLI